MTGKILWTYTGWQCMIPVAQAVDAGEGKLLLAGGYNAGSAMIQIVKKEDGTFGGTSCSRTGTSGPTCSRRFCTKNHFYAQFTTNERRMVW
ncbi:MAG: hypothetical protein IPP47_19750 [Bryobacterales bacterium]|nr:hypothetical protein [Bryobacterales bacterium]